MNFAEGVGVQKEAVQAYQAGHCTWLVKREPALIAGLGIVLGFITTLDC